MELVLQNLQNLVVQSLRNYVPVNECASIMARHRREYDAVAYAHAFEYDTESSLIDIPNAFDFVFRRENNYDIVIKAIAEFIHLYSKMYSQNDIYRAMLGAIDFIFLQWTSTIECTCYVQQDELQRIIFKRRIKEEVDVDMLLDCLSMSSVVDQSDLLHHSLLMNWASSADPMRCATFFDFCLRVKCCPTSLDIYRDRFVIELAFSTNPNFRLSETALHIIAKRCSGFYASVVRQYALNDSSGEKE